MDRVTTRVAILGDLKMELDGLPLEITTPKERALLAVLALRQNERVSTSTLLDALWGEHPPPTAERTLGTHVSRLRRMIGVDILQGTSGTGHGLAIAPDDVDVHQMAQLLDNARALLDAGRPDDALRAAAAAGALWRGEPLRDLADGPLRHAECSRLEALRSQAVELQIKTGLAAGHHEQLVGELGALVEESPLREDLWGHLMLALYRCGRQADALRAFARLRAVLVDQLGIEPSPPLVRLERMILHQDHRLDLAPPPPPPDNLPATSTSLIGRADEVAEITDLLNEHRMVTLVGPGGVGKTRLALAVARSALGRFGDGAVWLDLATTRSPEELLPHLADAIGLGHATGVPLDEAALRTLRGREMLVVLDNCEHLLDDVVALAALLLERAPMLTLLATSRENLGLAAEHLVQVAPLAVEATADSPASATPDAVLLLSERARAVDSRWADIPADVGSDICRRLDGIPLAIELVASRARSLSPHELRTHLLDRIGPLEDNHGLPDSRYDSLRDAFEWSVALLEPVERDLLSRLSVVPATFGNDLIAALGSGLAEQSSVDRAFHRLVSSSLVQQVTGGEEAARFRLLESIREYAGEACDTATAELVQRLHARHFAARAAACDTGLSTSDRLRILRWARRETGNLRAAVAWSMEYEDPNDSLVFAPVIGSARYDSGDLQGSRRLLEALLAGSEHADPRRRAAAMNQLAWSLLFVGEGPRAWELLENARALAASVDDTVRVASIDACRGHTLLLGLGDHEAAIPHYARAIAASDPERSQHEWALARLGMAQALVLGDRPGDAEPLLAETELRLHPEVHEHHLAHLCLDRALVAWSVGDVETIVPLAERGVEHGRTAVSTAWEQINLVAAGTGYLVTDRQRQAEVALIRASRLALEDQNRLQLGIALQCLAALEADKGAATAAARLFGAGVAFAPLWPLMERGLDPYLGRTRRELGSRFDDESALGATISPDDAVAYALASRA